MLKYTRVVLAVLSIAMVTLLFVDFTGTAAHLWPWMAKVQLIPALLSANALALAFIIALTLVFGRVYCSVICPLGILQDIANWLRVRVSTKKKGKFRFRYSHARTRRRLVILSVFVVLLIIGLTQLLAASIAGLIEPYSAYGRIAASVFAPAWDFANNLLAAWSERQVDNYAFYRVATAVSMPILAIAVATLAVVLTMAWRGGRDYCNTICPVGTMLGYLSKYSLLKIAIDTDKCRNCGLCSRACKAKCIDGDAHTVDYTRCVGCMDCIGICHEGAITYALRRKAAHEGADSGMPDQGRRGFVSTAGLIAGALIAEAAPKTDGGLTQLKRKKAPERATRVVPAGAISPAHLGQHCTGCQLCVQACPQGVLKPTMSLDGFMQPSLDFTEGYCHTECTDCSKACPAGAFHPVSPAEKSAIKIGTAVVDSDACLSYAEGVNCGSCAAHCPAGAIEMISPKGGNGNLRPVVNEGVCIGCGACECYCPVGTVKSMQASSAAIHVEGLQAHQEI